MVIARMLVRGGLLMLTLTAAMATAKAVGRIIRSSALSDAGPHRARTRASPPSIRCAVHAPVPSAAIRKASSCLSRLACDRNFIVERLVTRRGHSDNCVALVATGD